jgi:hypothetical protein
MKTKNKKAPENTINTDDKKKICINPGPMRASL